MTDFAAARKNMIDGQIHTAGVSDEKILNAFSNVPRELFVAEKLRDISYLDQNIDLGQGRFLIEPIALGRMVQACTPTAGDTVLVVGGATGYVPALLSELVATVISVESNKRHIEKAERLYSKLDICNVVTLENTIEQGDSENAPYNLIFINGAVEKVPGNILAQLDENGRLVCVLKEKADSCGRVVLFVKGTNGNVSSRIICDAQVPYLKEFSPELQFSL